MSVQQLSVQVAETGETVVNNVGFKLLSGRIFALVGESGSGKSVTSLATMRLLPGALQITSGLVQVADEDLFALPESSMRTVRGRKVAMIFQNAMSALNPVQTAGEQVAETLRLHTNLGGAALRRRVVQLFAEVGIPDPE
ncbi:MAG: ABC transporter ATP-binding protein, partial [Halioglobus sp.]|nr:ABC transporter ATP-binding protein [Halioglobus sp.]